MTPSEKEMWKQEIDWRPFVAEDLVYKMDEWHGMRKGEFAHVGFCSTNLAEKVKDPEGLTLITTNGAEYLHPSVSPDGSKVAFMGYPYTGAKGRAAEMFVYDISDSKVSQLTRDAGIYADHAPAWTDDSKTVIGVGYPSFDDCSVSSRPIAVDLESGDVQMLISPDAEEVCDGLHPIVVGRTERDDYRYYLKVNGVYLYFQSFHNGKGGVYRVPLNDKKSVEAVLTGRDVHGFSISDRGDVLCVVGGFYEPPELYISAKVGRGKSITGSAEEAGARLERLTHSNDWILDYDLGKVHSCWTKSRDGEADLQYWIVTPPGYDENKAYPAVYDAKGGPSTCHTESFWHEFQALAAEDIIVVYGNPRGSVGYGRKFNADMICWKDKAMEDHLAIMDAAIDEVSIDADHLGITGGSYGGYMTMKLNGRTDTFTVAVAQRALANPLTSYGTGDMGFVSAGGPVDKSFSMYEYLEDRTRGNIISYVDQMKSPLLILHAADDYRCGFEQAEQIFIPMKERNPEIPVRLVRFPGENHGLTRDGNLFSQMRHLREMTRWFRKYLVEEPWQRIDTGAKFGLSVENRLTVNGIHSDTTGDFDHE